MSDDWRKGARIVEAEWEDAEKRLEPQRAAAATMHAKLLSGEVKFSWLGAAFIWAGMDRNPKPLIDLLRSDEPIAQEDRENLAKAIEMAELAPVKRHRGRPKNRSLHEVATFARMIFRQWRNANAERGIKDYGHRSEMMDEAIEMAKRVTRHGADIGSEAIREQMERPTSRQK